MIRHSSSFFISLTIHLTLLLLLIYTWKNYSIAAKEIKEKKVFIELCNVVSEKQIQKPVLKPKPKSKAKKVEIQKPKAEPLVVPLKKEIVKPLIEEIKEPEIIEELITKKPAKEVKEAKEEVVEEVNTESQNEIKQDSEVKKPKVEKAVATKEEVVEVKIVKTSPKNLEEEYKIKQQNLTEEYVEINTEKIAQLLQENLYYPRSARKRGIVGNIIVKFTLGVDAKVYDLEVTKSNSDILSRAALKTINNLSGEFPKPKQEITLHVPIGYSLK